MRFAMVLLFVLVPAATLLGKTKPKVKPAKTAAVAKPSIYAPLVEARRFSLSSTAAAGSYISVESYDVRTVGAAKVARLRWTLVQNGVGEPLGGDLPTQLALGKKGVWAFSDRLGDKEIAKELKKKPTWTDPPAIGTRKDGTYVRKDGEAICFGQGTAPGTAKCNDVCHAEFCLAPERGVVAIGGLYTPNSAQFVAPEAGQVPPEVQIGVPECDMVLGKYYLCMQQVYPQNPEMLESVKQWAEHLRGQATTPDGRQAVAAQCTEFEPQIREMVTQMGCAY
jgi:hypothetical protein